jgi:hypothetical protein
MFGRKMHIFFLEVLGLALFFALAITSQAKAGTLFCSVASSCAGGVVIYRMSGATNAHAELANQLNVNYNNNLVCCTGVVGLSNTCSGTFATALKLNGATNAHVQQSGTYSTSSCISVPAGGSVTVAYQATNCTGYDTTLGSMSGTTNAHVGNTSAYTTKICASAAGTPDPSIANMITCDAGGNRDSACGTNAAPEYSASDTYGLIQLNGSNFGATAGTVQFTGGFGGPISATVHATAEGACSVGGWTNTSVCVEVNSTISNTIYDGTVLLTRSGDAKTSSIGLRIQPRITANNPVNGASGDTIEINGDHFCQTGTCPTTPPTTDYIAYFGSTQALSSDFVTTCSGGQRWSDTQVCVKIPSGTAVGSQKTKIQGQLTALYESQRQAFTVQLVTPATPSDLKQSRNSGFTNLIATGGYASSTPVYFSLDTSSTVSGGTMYQQVEVRPVLGANKDFVSTCAAGTYCKEGTGVAYTSGTQTLTVSTSTPDNSYHWQTRVRYNKNSINYYSSWQSYPDTGGNPETDTDLIVDVTAPVITFTPTDTCAGGQSGLDANDITINWSLNETGDGQLIYSKNSNLSSAISFPAVPQADSFSHSVSLTGLDSGTTYYYKVKSYDLANNLGQRPLSSPYCSFVTTIIDAPTKTTSFYITGNTSSITSLSTSSFSVIAPEDSPVVKSAFVEVTGLVSGGNPISIQVNNVSSRNYSVSGNKPYLFKFIYQISSPNSETNLNLNDAAPCTNGHLNNPPCNMLSVTPGSSVDFDIYSARLIMTYAYTR